MPRYVLGFDSSTQSLSAVLLDLDAGRSVGEERVVFASELPHYHTDNGVLRDPANPQVVHAPPLMWLEALDLLCAKLKAERWPLAEVLAVSGSGQQHGTVYCNNQLDAALALLSPERPLAEQLQCCFSRPTSPVWMDSSTSASCAAIAAAAGGAEVVLARTGSVPTERFSGPQIHAFAHSEEQMWAGTTHICLVSSFLASVLCGQVAPIDHADGSGMNLLDIHSRNWDRELLAATAQDLDGRLLAPRSSQTVMGPISHYFVERYGFSAACKSVLWSGDNPCSLIGLGLVGPGQTAISLGTSDTCFSYLDQLPRQLSPEANIFCAPNGGWMSLLCFKNGSLARERVRRAQGLDWAGFSACLQHTPPGNDGALMLPWFDPEIVPRVLHAGVVREGYKESERNRDCRAVVEGQMLAMRLHLDRAGTKPTSIRATGGGSGNVAMLQVMADVFQVTVSVLASTSSAAIGAALRAAHALDPQCPWSELVAGFTQALPGKGARPNPASAAVYEQALQRYADLETKALRQRG